MFCMGFVILLWHSLSLPYNYSINCCKVYNIKDLFNASEVFTLTVLRRLILCSSLLFPWLCLECFIVFGSGIVQHQKNIPG